MLELREITKSFGDVLANDHVNIVVKPGTIHAIVGENGAGKSTAMRIAYGFYTADSGEILVDGQVRDIKSPHDAIALGIGMVHQHFMLVETMTVAENIVLGAEPGSAAALDLKSVRILFNGAEPISVALCEEFLIALSPHGLPRSAMFPVYGLAEASLAATFPEPEKGYSTISVRRDALAVGTKTEPRTADDPDASTLVLVGNPVSFLSG